MKTVKDLKFELIYRNSHYSYKLSAPKYDIGYISSDFDSIEELYSDYLNKIQLLMGNENVQNP